MTRSKRRKLVNLIYRLTAAKMPHAGIRMSSLRRRYPDTNYDIYIHLANKEQVEKLRGLIEKRFETMPYEVKTCDMRGHHQWHTVGGHTLVVEYFSKVLDHV